MQARQNVGFLFLLPLLLAADAPASGKANRLARETSPYLQQHAHNPVDWYPWGPEAFAKAAKENKLIFLSIGYSSCHWCHVMERESFSNADVAKYLNDRFVCIKVDREERPDIDEIYMTALQMMRQNGGWPLSMFLTPDGKPIFGGTYWPPQDRQVEGQTMRGFTSIMKLVDGIYQKQPAEVKEQADKFAKATAEALGEAAVTGLGTVDGQTITAAIDALSGEFDPVYGGFGRKSRNFQGTKFPRPPALGLLFEQGKQAKEAPVLQMIERTLDRMARGGIYDQLGGGFHRYSTERTWTVPHFEKMLYDNAQLVELYSRVHSHQANPLYRRAVAETLAFIDRELTSPEGAFYSALDADSEGIEGRFYVWTDAELEAALGSPTDVALIKAVYGADDEPVFEEKYHILRLRRPLAEVAKERQLDEATLEKQLAPLKAKLFDVRAKRPRPFLDTKVLTAWNGQMIAGYALAGQAFAEPRYLATATKAADFVLKTLRTPEGRLLRTYSRLPGTMKGEARLNGYLDDYAFLVHGLLALHESTGEARWLTEAKALTETMIRWHADDKRGGFFYTSHDHEKLFARAKDQYDGAQPSGNSVAALNLVRLFRVTGEARYKQLAERCFQNFATNLENNPSGMATMVQALLLLNAGQGLGDDLPAKPKAKDSSGVVKATAVASKVAADGKQTVTVTLTIDQDWYNYANPVGNDTLDEAQTKVTVLVDGKPFDAKITYPKGEKVEDTIVGDYYVYRDKAVITATLPRKPGDSSVPEVRIKLQSCNKKGVCLLPATIAVKATVEG